METTFTDDSRRGLIVVVAGGLIAALLGAEAGASLRLQAGERTAPPQPQLFVMTDREIAALEQRHAGWPGRQPG